MDRVQISGMSRVIRLLVGLSVMVLAVSAGRFLGIEQVNNLVDQAMAVASAQGPRITIQKFTNGHDADDAPGPSIFVGRALTWEYEIHNPNATGDLRSISLFDDKEGQIPCPLSVLAPGASMTCTRPGTAMDGPYENTASVFAFWVSTGGGTRPSSASDSSHYVGTPGPRELKTEALDALRAFVPSPPFDRSAQRRLGRAIDHVDRSLRADLWVDAYRADPRKGHRVFDEEDKAAYEIQRLLRLDLGAEDSSRRSTKSKKSKKSKKSRSGGTIDNEDDLFLALGKLAAADDALADEAIARAVLAAASIGCTDGDYRDLTQTAECQAIRRVIQRARNELDRGRTEVTLRNFVGAIRHFKAAWQLAT